MPTLTAEEKKRFAPMLTSTWEAIAPDVIMSCPETEYDRDAIIEVTCDANHPEMYGGMSRAEYDRLGECYNDPDTMSWLKVVLNY